MDKIITVPFGYLLDFLYQLTSNYGVSLIIFAVMVQIVLLPISAKSKKSMMKMSRLQPRLNAIKEQYANDQRGKDGLGHLLADDVGKEEGVQRAEQGVHDGQHHAKDQIHQTQEYQTDEQK